MTKLHKAKILDELGIEWKINDKREMICLVNTDGGPDNKEWLNAGEVIQEMKDQRLI